MSREAVEAGAKALFQFMEDQPWEARSPVEDDFFREAARKALAAAADVALMQWKLEALTEWSKGMIQDSYYPQYGRDVKTILEVKSLDEAREIDAMGYDS